MFAKETEIIPIAIEAVRVKWKVFIIKKEVGKNSLLLLVTHLLINHLTSRLLKSYHRFYR